MIDPLNMLFEIPFRWERFIAFITRPIFFFSWLGLPWFWWICGNIYCAIKIELETPGSRVRFYIKFIVLTVFGENLIHHSNSISTQFLNTRTLPSFKRDFLNEVQKLSHWYFLKVNFYMISPISSRLGKKNPVLLMRTELAYSPSTLHVPLVSQCFLIIELHDLSSATLW